VSAHGSVCQEPNQHKGELLDWLTASSNCSPAVYLEATWSQLLKKQLLYLLNRRICKQGWAESL